MNKKQNYEEYLQVLKDHGITRLYHFTDRENLESIINSGGLYSWADCEEKGIKIARPGGADLSRQLDTRDGLQHYVRLSFIPNHPMMFVAMNEGRISNPVVLEIDIEAALWETSMYADRNMTKNGAKVGSKLDDLKAVKLNLFHGHSYFDMDDEDKIYFKAEVLVKNFIPLQYITNIGNFGYTIPSVSKQMITKVPYTAQITRNTPTAFIFLIDESVSMGAMTKLGTEEMTMAEAVARIVNNQINELVLRCIKSTEVRHYYDIAIIGYGHEVHSAWRGELEGRDFVSPDELKQHPYKKITVREEKRTRKGIVEKEVEKVQWIEARHDGRWTYVHKAFARAKQLLDEWMEDHHEQDCYPPTIINITDGVFNGASKETVLQGANELKSMFTNDGNVILFNIHITPSGGLQLVFPTDKSEVESNEYATTLYELSSLLPTRYNEPISSLRHDSDAQSRHVAMAVNSDMSTLIQLMDIGTPTNISQNK